MKRRYQACVIGVTVAVLGLLVATRPSDADFAAWAVRKIGVVSPSDQGVIADMSRASIYQMVLSGTRSSDMVIARRFEVPALEGPPRLVALGVFGQLVTLRYDPVQGVPAPY